MLVANPQHFSRPFRGGRWLICASRDLALASGRHRQPHRDLRRGHPEGEWAGVRVPYDSHESNQMIALD